ncbi:MAG: hypothetical protein ACRDMX_14740, partial [Solirubrobacteraceae bacterium]
ADAGAGAAIGPTAGATAARARERSVWMVVAMLACLVVSIGLGVHLPGQLAALLTNAAHRLAVPV